jgi:hypothetical protein
MTEFLAHAALAAFAAAGTGLVLAGAVHYALATDPYRR